jgi:hypothetical protein
LEKQQLVRKGLLQLAKNHYQRRVVLIETVFWKCRQKSAHGQRQKTLLAEANASAKRNLISVGGCADTPSLWMSMQQVMSMESAHVSATVRLCCRRDMDADVKKDIWDQFRFCRNTDIRV